MAASPPASAAGKLILVIDDSDAVREIITLALNGAGFQVIDAHDGHAGLALVRERKPDLVLCDITMPQLDGYAVLSTLRQDEGTARIPFIFLTGALDKSYMRRGMELGADDYLTKPFSNEELLAAVQSRLKKMEAIERESEQKLAQLRGSLSLALPHELRTPLNGILGLSGIMVEDYATMPPEEVLESARFIQEAATRLHRLIENFLIYAQIAVLGDTLEPLVAQGVVSPILMQPLVERVAREVAARYKRENDLQLEAGDGALLAPEEYLKKIVEELVDNAFKFSAAGQFVRVTSFALGAVFGLLVVDHGRGMTSEQIARIGAHMQFDRSTFEQQGAGLGLTITKRITEMLGGRFSIHSTPGAGTTVQVTLNMPGI